MQNLLFLNKKNLYLVGILTPLILFPFSPLFCFFFSALSLIFFSQNANNVLRIYLSLLGFISLAYISGSRAYVLDLRLDLSVYYGVFNKIRDSKNFFDIVFSFSDFGGGIEFGIVVLYKIYSIIFEKVTPFDLAIYSSIICCLGLLVWFESFGKYNIPQNLRGICVVFIMMFVSINSFGFLQRQALATFFILLALEMKKRRWFFFYTLIAFLFHTTSLPIVILWRYLLNKKLTKGLIIKSTFFFVVCRIFFSLLIHFLAQTGFNKFQFYLDTGTFVVSYNFLLIVLLLVVFNIIYYKEEGSKWKTPIVVMGIFYFCFVGIPLFSERINYIFYYLAGYFLLLTLYKRKEIFNIVFLFMFLYFFRIIAIRMGIINVVTDDPFWIRYNVSSLEPFYYIFK